MGSKEKIILGEKSYIGKGVDFIYASGNKVVTGKYCSMARNIKFYLGGNHRVDWISTYPFTVFNEAAKGITGHPTSKGDITIGNDVWIGRDATIFSGVKIGDGAVVGASSVVGSDVEPYSIVVGNPARVIKKRFSDEVIEQLLKIKWWDWPAKKINKNIHLLCSDSLDAFIDKHRIDD